MIDLACTFPFVAFGLLFTGLLVVPFLRKK
jgi:hypothetical protein